MQQNFNPSNRSNILYNAVRPFVQTSSEKSVAQSGVSRALKETLHACRWYYSLYSSQISLLYPSRCVMWDLASGPGCHTALPLRSCAERHSTC
jgi:hypothetical protein